MGKYRYNRYRDLEIDVSRLDIRPNDRAHFEQVIKSEYDKWASKLDRSRERFTAVMWLNVAKSISHVVPWLIDMHYEMHHATTCRIMFVRVHPDSRGTAQIPSYGTHYVKVECVVVEEGTRRVLMVRERIGTESSLKLVSGSSEAGEFFADAAMREVYEETGIRCRFGSLIGCGNRLRTRFDRDEIIMGCLLYAVPLQIPKADGSEVSQAAWFEVDQICDTCTPMAREWLAAAHACQPDYAERIHTDDLFRGHSHSMDFYVPRLCKRQRTGS